MSPTTSLHPTEKTAFRLGALFLALAAFVGVLPLTYLAAYVVDLTQLYPLKVVVLAATWLTFGFILTATVICEVRPSPRHYLAVVASDALVFFLWAGWLAWGLNAMQ